MRKKDKFADEKVRCFYEIDENFDDLNFLNIKNCDTEDKETEDKDTKDKDKKNTERELTEDELCLSLAYIMLIKKWEFDESGEEDLIENKNYKEKELTPEEYEKAFDGKEEKRIDKKQITKFKKAAKRYLVYKDTAKKGGTVRGIYKDLEEKLGLDLRPKETDSSKEKFDKLKLLKQICIAEKLGVYRAGEMNKEYPEIMGTIPIINIIENPKLKNVCNDYEEDSLYSNEFEVIYDNVKNQVPNAEEIEKTLYDIHDQWKKVLNLSYNDIIFSSFTPDKSKSTKAQRDLIKKIPVKFDEFLTAEESGKSDIGVMERFFTMMVTAKIRAEISDYCKIVFSYSNEQNSENGLLSLFDNNTVLDNEFLMSYVNNEFYNAELTAYAFVEKMEHGSDDERIDIWKLILMKNISEIPDIKKSDINAYNYASDVERMEYTAKFWMNKENERNFKMPVDKWCILFRELIYIYLKDEGISTYNQKGESVPRTLSAIIKSLNPNRNVKCSNSEPSDLNNKKRKPRTERFDRQEALSNMALRNRLKNRLILLYGSPEIVDYRNEIERHILSIEKNVFSYQTIDEIKRASRIMLYVTALYSPSNEELTLEEYEYNKEQFYDCNLVFLNPDKRRYFFGAIKIDEYFVLSERPKELIEAEKAFYNSKSIWDYLNNGRYYSAYQKIVLSDEAKKYSKLKKEYFVFKKARNIIIEELYSFGIVTIGNNRKSVKIFGIDGELYNIKISYVNSYSTKKIVITDIKFDEDVQKVIYAIEKQKN